MSYSFLNSEKALKRALEVIPLGSQTFSKSKTQFPFGVSPYFVTRAAGSRTWDVDGNEYVDFIGALAAITLGYNDPDVTAAVRAQLEGGVIFSLPHPIETEVAELLREVIPCAEMSRFGKNGSDATAGAVRLARAYTGRDRVIVCGYHGWQDWYIGSTARNKGVPRAVSDLTHPIPYNDLASAHELFKKHPGEIAAVITEPMNTTEPKPGFLEGLKELAHKNGALLIFDETITGFRFSIGGAQKVFGVTPDLATFGKGMANGFPVSVIVGKAEIMRMMEEIFFSFTFGGETLSLAAAKATITKIQKEPVIEKIAATGRTIQDKMKALLASTRASEFITISGHPSWSFLNFSDSNGYSQWQIKTLFLQEMFKRGILMLTTNNISYSHGQEDIALLSKAYAEVFALLSDAIGSKTLELQLRCAPLEPLFKVR